MSILGKLFGNKSTDTNFITAKFNNYRDYIDIQYRSKPREFMDSRIKVVSSFVYLLPILKLNNVTKPKLETRGRTKGQLKNDEINILDAGCRDGWTIEFLNSLGFNKVIGVELFDDYIKYCKSKGRNAVKGDLHKLTFKTGIFDFVYCRHTLEHCIDPVKATNEMLRVTRHGGLLFCNFPSEQHTYGKHTAAFPNLQAVKKLISKLKYKFEILELNYSEKTGIIIPEGKEIYFILKRI